MSDEETYGLITGHPLLQASEDNLAGPRKITALSRVAGRAETGSVGAGQSLQGLLITCRSARVKADRGIVFDYIR